MEKESQKYLNKKQKEELIRKPENIEKFLSDKINCDEFIHMKSKV